MKKKLSIILCTTMLFCSFPMNIQASELSITTPSGISVKSSEPTSENLQKITSGVKSRLSIPKSLTNFDYHYNEGQSNSTVTWELVWSNAKETERISVLCDEDANIINYYHSSNDEYLRNKPKYLKSELQGKAEQFIKKIAPSVGNKIKITDQEQVSIYSGQYTYNYVRMEGKIPMPDNGISVSVNYETGEITSCSINWLYGLTIPSSTATVTKKEATGKINETIKMNLAYKAAYSTDKSGNTVARAFLVYEPDKDYISVDAKTGKVYLTKNEYIQNYGSPTTDTASDGATTEEKNADASLTEKEIQSIDKLKDLISKDSAIQKIKGEESLLIDSNATSIDAYLTQSYSKSNDKDFVWNISFSDPRNPENQDYRAYANASVDAKTGQILSFYASVPNYYDIGEDKWDEVKVNYTKDQGQNTFENFLKKQIPSYFNKSKLSNTDHDYIIAYKEQTPVYGGYRYNYDRVNEKVAYSYNGISGSVDGVTGKIYRYNFDWDENLKFESTKGVITPKEAFDYYIGNEGYDLVYEINTIHNIDKTSIKATDEAKNSVIYQVRLVYRTDIYPTTISPFTGKQLDYNGEEYVKVSTYSYTDIESHKAKSAILLLADMGVGFEGNKFLPDKKITTGEYLTLLEKLNYNIEDLKLNKNSKIITRTNGVKSLIKLAGLDNVANIKGIYKTNFKDQNQIATDDLGYVAIAKGLGIVSGTTFRPKDSLTRGEAAQMIVNFLKADIN